MRLRSNSYIIKVKVNFSKETFPTRIRIGLFFCQRLFILKMQVLQVLLQCNSLAREANDQFSSSFAIALAVCIGVRCGIKKNSFNNFFIASVKL
jgi:hypothetical protein